MSEPENEPPKSTGETRTAYCVACRGDLVFFGSRCGYAYHTCRACHSLQLFPMPSRADLDLAYATEYASAQHFTADAAAYQRSARHYFQNVIRVLRDSLPQGRVSEIGAGWGVAARFLIDAGFRYEGVEPSQAMSKYCEAQQLPVRRGGIEDLAGNERDALFLTNVFEHLVGHDAWLNRARALLPDGGLLLTAQPTAAFPRLFGTAFRLGIKTLPLPQLHAILAPPWHTVLFSVRGMQSLLSRHGFQLIRLEPAPQNREPGLAGLLQRILEAVNRVGWLLAGKHWPLVIGHIFVFQKSAQQK